MIGLPLEKLSYSWGQKWVQKTTCIFEPYEGPPLLTLLYNLSVHDLLYTYTLVYIYIYITDISRIVRWCSHIERGRSLPSANHVFSKQKCVCAAMTRTNDREILVLCRCILPVSSVLHNRM